MPVLEVDQAAMDRQMKNFALSIATKEKQFNRIASSALRIEGDRLCQTLMRDTPPKNKGNAAKKIDRDVDRKFHRMAMETGDGNSDFLTRYAPAGSPKHGSGDVYWYVWTDRILYGLAKTEDYTSANAEGLKALYRQTKLNKRGMVDLGKRGKQDVRVWQKWLVKKATVNKLKRLLAENIGRAKAGWAVGWRALGSGTGIYNPPEWVTKHVDRNPARFGRCDTTRMHDTQIPELTITNTAKNISKPNFRRIAFQAMGVRMISMRKRVAALIRHPELIDQDFD
jgi:hypothetical protein